MCQYLMLKNKSEQNILNEVGAPETNIHYWIDSVYNDCISQISKFEETYDINGFY